MTPTAPVSARNAFSLVELLVSMAVLSTMMLLLFGFFDQATKAWQNSEKKIDAFREARAALYYLKRDLQAMVVTDEIPWLYYDDPQTTPEISYSGAIRSPDTYGDAIFFISNQPTNAQDPSENLTSHCAIGYYLAYSPDPGHMGGGISSYKLYRYFKSSGTTWNENGTQGLFAALDTSAPLFLAAEGRFGGDEVIARYITDFFIRPMQLDALTGNLEPLENETGGPLSDGEVFSKPKFMNVSFKAFSFASAQKLTTQDQWHDPPGNLAEQDPQQFTVRIPIQ